MMMQPHVSAGFLQNPMFAEQGIHARFHIVRSAPWHLTPVDFTDPANEARRDRALDGVGIFTNRIYELLNRPLSFDDFGRLSPATIGWSHDAKKVAWEMVKAYADIRNDPASHSYAKRMA